MNSSVTDESCCDAEAERGVRLWRGGPQPTKDNANDTAFSPVNTCLANTLNMREAARIKPKTLKTSFLYQPLARSAGILPELYDSISSEYLKL